MRLFISLEAPESWRDVTEAQQLALFDALDEDGQDSVRIVSRDLMHVTLRFLGDVDEGGVDTLQAALDAIDVPEIPLTLARAGTFGQPAPIWAVYLGIGGDLDALSALRDRVEAAVRVAGIPPERTEGGPRQFTPHLTLARVQRSATPQVRDAIAEVVRDLDDPPPTPHVAREIALVSSYLDGPKPRYEVLSRHA